MLFIFKRCYIITDREERREQRELLNFFYRIFEDLADLQKKLQFFKDLSDEFNIEL